MPTSSNCQNSILLAPTSKRTYEVKHSVQTVTQPASGEQAEDCANYGQTREPNPDAIADEHDLCGHLNSGDSVLDLRRPFELREVVFGSELTLQDGGGVEVVHGGLIGA